MPAYLYTDSQENYSETRNWISDLLRHFSQAVSAGMNTASSQSLETEDGITLSVDDRRIDLKVIDLPCPAVPSGQMIAVEITENGPREIHGLSIPFTSKTPYVNTVTMWTHPSLAYDKDAVKGLFAHHLMAAARGPIEKNVASNLRFTQEAMDQAVEIMNAEEPLRVMVISMPSLTPTA